MNKGPKLYLIAYDISDNDRLRQVYKIMRGFGDHVQYSVFCCVLSDKRKAELVDKLCDAIHHAKDQVLFVPLGAAEVDRASKWTTMGRPLMHPERCARVV